MRNKEHQGPSHTALCTLELSRSDMDALDAAGRALKLSRQEVLLKAFWFFSSFVHVGAVGFNDAEKFLEPVVQK